MKSYLFLVLALLSAHFTLAQGRRSAEVFLQVEDRGSFTVYLDQEFVGSNQGKFRFYDVYDSKPTLSILQGTKKVFSARLDVRLGQRLVLNFSRRQGLRTLKSLDMFRNNQYVLNDFDDYVGAYNTGIVPPRPSRGNNDNFESLLAMVSREPFDDEKIKLANIYAANQYLTTAEATQLLQKINGDDKKLSLAKALAPAISDIQKYYGLKDVFTFKSNKDAFVAFMGNFQSQQPRAMMRSAAFEQLKASVRNEPFDEEKSKVIQAALRHSMVSTAQLGELLRMYSFEDKALIMAKQAFALVSDRQNYFTLKDVFKFQSNQKELLDFLAR